MCGAVQSRHCGAGVGDAPGSSVVNIVSTVVTVISSRFELNAYDSCIVEKGCLSAHILLFEVYETNFVYVGIRRMSALSLGTKQIVFVSLKYSTISLDFCEEFQQNSVSSISSSIDLKSLTEISYEYKL